MNPTEYMEGVMRTECPYEPVRARLKAKPGFIWLIHQALSEGVLIGQFTDRLKRGLLYGDTSARGIDTDDPVSDFYRGGPLQKLLTDETLLRLLHAFLGKMTEAAELEEALFAVLFNDKKIDRVNIKEEIGDSEWYDGIALDAIGSTFEECMRTNNSKLRSRFPDKFEAEQAIERDLGTEREVLEMTDASIGEIVAGTFTVGTCDASKTMQASAPVSEPPCDNCGAGPEDSHDEFCANGTDSVKVAGE